MFEIGDHVVYGMTGVCRIAGVSTLPDHSNAEEDALFYVLAPIYEKITIYVPVDDVKTPMRKIMSVAEVEKLIDFIPQIRVRAYRENTIQELAKIYKEKIVAFDCTELIELTMSIYEKKQNGKHGAVDKRFMKLAEDLLFGEFAVVLGIPKEGVQDFIERRVGA
ncbi:MAG: CarD family transcriptional regulator [Clostridiales Family XIII bacterium]|jgi:CarD family transcriptional regulator|nr:CarD family transcriptional regulator [Clostridiales Family XIII bacterium]